MSSGVDSSAAAALLKKQGYEVVGVFFHFWKEPKQDALRENKCCSLDAQIDARKVARILNIPLYTVNASKEFKKKVVDYFLSENKAGRTPNPCVACNESIKFNFLFRKMLEMKADYVASGHYAIKKQTANGRGQTVYKLFQGKDKEKDQTYFLHNLTQNQLAKILFPIGVYKKQEIRLLAKKMKLPVFDKDDSQGLCFTPEKHPSEFLRRHLRLKKGKIKDISGKVIGIHDGLPLYTIGQRRGINIGDAGPYYVAGKDLKKNILIVTNDKENPFLFSKSLEAKNVNWITGVPKTPLRALIKIRYRHPAFCGTIKRKEARKTRNTDDKTYFVEFDEHQRAVTPGQSVVFYSNKGELLGGGKIK